MDFFTKKEQMIILSIAIILLAYFGVGGYIRKEQPTPPITLLQAESTETQIDPDLAEEPTLVMVHVSGQVYYPGIYELVSGDRVKDAVDLAGGLTKAADIDRINLAKKVKDEEKIYIPAIGENISMEIDGIDSGNSSGLININICSKEELDSLPGIGEVIAERIIEYRKTNKFTKIEEIRNVSGIGDSKFNDIKDLITVD
jgi:competence protein ComEA